MKHFLILVACFFSIKGITFAVAHETDEQNFHCADAAYECVRRDGNDVYRDNGSHGNQKDYQFKAGCKWKFPRCYPVYSNEQLFNMHCNGVVLFTNRYGYVYANSVALQKGHIGCSL